MSADQEGMAGSEEEKERTRRDADMTSLARVGNRGPPQKGSRAQRKPNTGSAMKQVLLVFPVVLTRSGKESKVQTPHRGVVRVFGVQVQSPIWGTRFWRPVSMKKGKGRNVSCIMPHIYWTEEKQSKSDNGTESKVPRP